MKTKVNNTPQNSKLRLRGDETVKHLISKCSKLVQKKYKPRHDWVGKVIYWELCKRLKFDYTTKWYMHKLESVREDKTHKILWDFVIRVQMNRLIPARRPDQVLINN